MVRFPYSVQYYLSSQWAVPIVEVSTFISVGELSGFAAVFVAPMLENFGAPVLHSIVGCAAAAGVLIVLSSASPNLAFLSTMRFLYGTLYYSTQIFIQTWVSTCCEKQKSLAAREGDVARARASSGLGTEINPNSSLRVVEEGTSADHDCSSGGDGNGSVSESGARSWSWFPALSTERGISFVVGPSCSCLRFRAAAVSAGGAGSDSAMDDGHAFLTLSASTITDCE